MNNRTKKTTFTPKYNGPNTAGRSPLGASQPPKNKIVLELHLKSLFPVSPKKNNAKPAPEYSTLYPETSSASASGRSNGCRFVSATALTKNLKKLGNKGTAYQIDDWLSTMSVKFNDPAHRITVTLINPIDTS